MDNKDELKKKEARKKQWDDRIEIAKNKAKLEQHKVEENLSKWSENLKKDWQHGKNVADEKATEAKNSINEAAQKTKHRWEEKTGK